MSNSNRNDIDTSKVSDRRTLQFSGPAALRAEVARIVAAEQAGRLRRNGNWSTGQILGHLAGWIDFAYDGWPPQLRPPWFVKLLVRLQKRRMLTTTMPPGFRIPKIEGGTLATEPLSLDEGLARFNRAWDRLEQAPPPRPNIIFGHLTHAEWQALHLRHAELHLGFVHPE